MKVRKHITRYINFPLQLKVHLKPKTFTDLILKKIKCRKPMEG